jgi:hypothetical protein
MIINTKTMNINRQIFRLQNKIKIKEAVYLNKKIKIFMKTTNKDKLLRISTIKIIKMNKMNKKCTIAKIIIILIKAKMKIQAIIKKIMKTFKKIVMNKIVQKLPNFL